MRRLTITLLFIWLISCRQKPSPTEVVIEGHVKEIPDGKVYLTEARHGNVFLDSTVAINGRFRFTIKPDSTFFPYMASICFPDSTSRNEAKTRQLVYANEFDRPKGLAKGRYNYTSSFYLERGTTQIYDENSSDESSDPVVKIRAGRENKLFYKDEIRGFGWPGQATLAKRAARIDLFKRHIEDHPYSYFLLQSVFDAKEQYSEREMNELLSLFDEDVQRSALGIE